VDVAGPAGGSNFVRILQNSRDPYLSSCYQRIDAEFRLEKISVSPDLLQLWLLLESGRGHVYQCDENTGAGASPVEPVARTIEIVVAQNYGRTFEACVIFVSIPFVVKVTWKNIRKGCFYSNFMKVDRI